MIRPYILLILLFLAVVEVQAAYLYLSWEGNESAKPNDDEVFNIQTQLLIDSKRKVVAFNDSGAPIKPCDRNWICVNSQVLHFAVPSKGRLPKRWKHNGFSFKKIGMERLQILGFNQEVAKIRVVNLTNTHATAPPMIYYYSRQSGIIGITIFWDGEGDEKISETFWSTEVPGFGAGRR